MKSEEFLEEVLHSTTCPYNFEKLYKTFTEYQKMVLNTLKEFHRVCTKNNINYHVTYGSLLGIIRDGGQIPWDYDIDTFVPASQKNDLIEALRYDLSDDYYAVCADLDSKCRHYIIRVCPKGYNSAAVHLDVFFYCGAPENDEARRRFNTQLLRCCQIRFSKKVNIKEESVGSTKRALKLAIAKIGSSIFRETCIDTHYEELIYKYPIAQSKYVVSADFFASWYLFPSRMLTETILYTSDIGEFRIPKDYYGFLQMVYGDYLKYPSIKTRISHVVNAVNRFNYFENIKDSDRWC